MTNPTRLNAIEAAAAIRTNVITSADLVGACLRRIAERDPQIGAWQHLNPAQARAAAEAADEAVRGKEPLGPLHGVPVAIKDIVDTKDYPTEYGTKVFAGRRPLADASLVTRLRQAGAIILGKTVTTELAFYAPGMTRNPRNLEHTPGGSSSGSAAAVADFHVPLALGTQTAGSILRPASYCGVPGFKPTFGTIPTDGTLEQSPPLDTIGGYALSMDDLALFVSIMSGKAIAVERPGPINLAFVRSPAWPQGEPAMQNAFERFVSTHGEIVEEVPLPAVFETTSGLQRAVQFRDIAKNFGPLLDAYPKALSKKLAEVIGEGRTVTDAEYREACGHRDSLNEALKPLFETYDAILTPASTGPAPKGLQSTGSPAFNFLWTYLGVPAISLPLLEAGGLPLGVQLVGSYGEDGKLLGVAERLIETLSAAG
jgi:Asp-tRNA(Asn)/Glu-tRNA(Gln) amidotransferase A subunit family amidase